VAPAGIAEIPKIVNVNWYSDPMGGMYVMGDTATDWGYVPDWSPRVDDFSVSDWLVKGLEGVADIALPLLEFIIDD